MKKVLSKKVLATETFTHSWMAPLANFAQGASEKKMKRGNYKQVHVCGTL